MELEPILPSPTETDVQSTGTNNGELSAGGNAKVEKQTANQEKASAPVAVPPTQITVQPVQASDDNITNDGSTTQHQPQSTNPQIADDVDVIEKEWVDKAKSIVSSTKDNPHMQEKEVSKLQADYLMKRYGKQMKTVD